MGKSKLDLQQVLKGVDTLLTSIANESERFLFSTVEEETSPARLRTMGSEALEEIAVKPRDGSAELEISPDWMEVKVNLYPAVGSGAPVTLETLEAQLEAAGVVHGVLTPVLRTIVAEAEFDHKGCSEVVVARGTAPIDAYPERWEVVPILLEKKKAVELGRADVDFKQTSPFVLVQKGQLLADRIPEQFGSQGWNVLGKAIEFAQLNPKVLQAGKNVEPHPEGFFAAIDGCFKVDASSFWVDEILVLEGGVSYTTGNIDFAGDVHVMGDIAIGFHIHSKGSVHSTKVMDATEIISGSDVTTPFGIIGHEGSVVKAEGKVQAKFLENVFVVARGSIEVQSNAMNCVLQTLDRFVMGDKGILVGGKVTAQNGIDVYQVGTERSAVAELICGMDFTVLEKMAWTRDQSVVLVKQLKTLEGYRAHHPTESEKIDAACKTIRLQILALSQQARDLVSRLDKNDDASIVVRGTVHQGTYVEICHVSFVVSKALKAVRFVLDKNHGAVKAIPL